MVKNNKKKKGGSVCLEQIPTKSRFLTRKSDMRRQTTKLLKFAYIYSKTKLWQKILISFIMGLIMSIVSVLLAESTGLYVGGLSSFFQGTARFTRSALLAGQLSGRNNLSTATINLIYTLMFWGQYLAVNIGLFFLAWRKIGHEFALLSLVYIVTLQGMGFAFDQIPALQQINLFGDTSTVNAILNQCEVKSIIFYPNMFPTYSGGVLDWSHLLTRNNADPLVVQTITNANITRSFCLILYAGIYAVLHAMCAAILLISGSSTAGSDILSIFFSYKKNKSVGSTMLIINGIGLVLGVFIGSYCSGLIVGAFDPTKAGLTAASFAGIQYLFSANLIGSIVWVILFTAGVNAFFPWKKMIKVEVISKQFKKIKDHLFDIGYQHPATVVEAKGAYSNSKVQVALFICQVVEVHKLISHIREIDSCCMISAQYVDDMDGNIAILRHTN